MPIQRQIYLALRDFILRGVLDQGTRLPATRELAKDLAISRNTAVRVYEQLSSEGYVETRQGSRTYVADLPSSTKANHKLGPEASAADLSPFAMAFDIDERIDFAPGAAALRPSTPDTGVFPFKTWNRLLGGHLLYRNVELLNYNFPYGYPPLQEAISKYVQAYRGVRCEPDQVLVTNGAQSGLDLLARVLLDKGDVVWMEEPGYVNARLVFGAAGADLRAWKVCEAGWDFADLPVGKPRVIYTTPSSQHPLGLTMGAEQRLRLLETASQHEAWVIEDDYDSEYRLAGRSVPAMQGNDAFGRTIYVGTFAKTMFPAIRIGFVVLPPLIAQRVKRAALYSGNQVSLPMQATLKDFIVNGHFARHLHRTRRLYAERRSIFTELVASRLGAWLQPYQSDVGIQIAYRLTRPMNDVAIARRANQQGLNVVPLSRYYSGPPVPGLLMGYAALDEKAMRSCLAILASVIETSEEIH
ncbi:MULTISPECIES: PLP-dependent aminotransferase family protein [unclassified Aureimonas]|uniref:MocR-like pyridoxine biosynthesis transcription factor PdxR n=1 Tax=unclassified Aureimonas TaxID=2615206 RepID=UPI001FCD80AF|nr:MULTISPECIES: PLP-dependent aminotransferase family protein [unclassified Aureimonas]